MYENFTFDSYGLDVNMDRVEDVLIHQKLLALAKDPEKRPVYHIRFLEVLPNIGFSIYVCHFVVS